MAEFPDDEELQVMGVAANAAIGEWEQKITQLKHQTYEDEDAWETMLAGQLRYLFNVIDRTGPPVTQGAIRRMRDLSAEWSTRRAELNSIANERIRPINEWARANDVTHVKLPR
jgi:wobble nucleotide-excising tRNase